LGHIRDIAYKHRAELSVLNEQDKCARLCELNVLEQADNVKRSSIVKEALKRGQPLQVHSWIYSLRNGRLKDLSKVR
jgi:carbonic anhydrase